TAPYTYAWDFGDGNTTRGTSNQATHTYSTIGPRVVQLFVNDSLGATGIFSRNVTVVAPIIVNVTCGTATSGKPVTCNASARGGTAPYTFTWASKGTPATGTGSSYTTTFATKGSQVVNATARDNNAVTRLSQATVNVAAQPIVVVVTCGTPTVNQPVTC